MSQKRLFFTASRTVAVQAFALLEARFEDDGLAISIFETDEASALFEVSVYAQDGVLDTRRHIQECLAGLVKNPEILCETLPDVDWVAHALDGLAPVRVGRYLAHGRHDRHLRRANDITIEIEAAQAFGTGHHGTTAGCLELIAKILRRDRPGNALDLGTGSAILAIAIAKSARIPVMATDMDPIAVQIAGDNARKNGVGSLVKAYQAMGFKHSAFSRNGPFGLIVANILARPLIELAPRMAHHIAPGGSLVLSGILDRQRRAVIAAYRGQGFAHICSRSREGWSTLHLRR